MTANLHLSDLKLTCGYIAATVSLVGVKKLNMWLSWAGQYKVMLAAHKTLSVF